MSRRMPFMLRKRTIEMKGGWTIPKPSWKPIRKGENKDGWLEEPIIFTRPLRIMKPVMAIRANSTSQGFHTKDTQLRYIINFLCCKRCQPGWSAKKKGTFSSTHLRNKASSLSDEDFDARSFVQTWIDFPVESPNGNSCGVPAHVKLTRD